MIGGGSKIGRRTVIGIPMAWLGIFFLLPFAFVLKISFAESILSRPPYSSLFSYDGEEGVLHATLNLGNYYYLIDDSLYVNAYLNSIMIAGVSTILCLLIGYPMSLAIARAAPKWRPFLLMLVVIPFWTSLLIRVYAWMGLLQKNGLINAALVWLGLIDNPQTMLQTDFAVYLGMVYTYLPFMILPLFAALERQDESLREAATDLGSSPLAVFRKITWPLSLPGVIAGCMLVFIPTVGEFVIPTLLGGTDSLMIGRVLWDEFFQNRDWPVASAVAIVMLLVLVIPIMIFQNAQTRTEEV